MPSRSKKSRFRGKKDGCFASDGVQYRKNVAVCQFRDDFHILDVFSTPSNYVCGIPSRPTQFGADYRLDMLQNLLA